MASNPHNFLNKKKRLFEAWTELQSQDDSLRDELISNSELRTQSDELLTSLLNALKAQDIGSFSSDGYDKVKETLTEISLFQAQKGFSPKETGLFVLSLKEAFTQVFKEDFKDTSDFYEFILKVNQLIDEMSLYTFETYLKGREDVIVRQRDEMAEISTPVIRLWEEILAIPIIGTLDSSRTQTVMESLLTEIVDTGSTIAILDISGVPAVDSLVAQHLIKTVSATRLMGAECIISGIRPEIAQTMVHLGIDLSGIVTKASLASALQHAFALQKVRLTRVAK